MKKSEIIIIVTIVLLTIAAIVVGVFALKGSEDEISSGKNEIGNFFSELFEKKEKEEEPEPEETASVEITLPEETEEPEITTDYDIDDLFEYDDRGNIIRENYGDYYIINQYDENNLKVLSLKHDKNDKVIHTTEFIYDENNTLIRKNDFDETGSHTSYTEYDYTDDGLRVESGYLPNGILMDKSYFDEIGFLVKSEYYYKGNLDTIYEFDPETFCGKMTSYDEDGNVIYYAEYDENGDIVKEESYE